jgi:RNA polymerase sigma-70 factor (ECF subfamily)
METATSGDEAASHDPAGMAARWPAAPDELDDDALGDDSGRTAASRNAKGPCLAQRATDPQLAEWIEAIVDQDERALASLYDATFSRVFGIVQRIVRRTALAEEVVEDTYFQVWRQAVRFDPARGHALTWLLAIARSRAIDALRHEARFQHESLDDETESATASEARPSDELLALARHQADLHQALLLLGAQPRQLISLAFFRGLSHEEIAQQTCLPLGTVKSQIRRALQTLQRILGNGRPAALAT